MNSYVSPKLTNFCKLAYGKHRIQKRKQINNQNRNQYQKIKNWRYFEGVTDNYTVIAQVRPFSCSYCRYFLSSDFFLVLFLNSRIQDSKFSIQTWSANVFLFSCFFGRSKLCLQGPVNGTYNILDLRKYGSDREILGCIILLMSYKIPFLCIPFQSWSNLSHSLGFCHSVHLLQAMWMNIICI